MWLRALLKGPTSMQILSWPHQGSNHRPCRSKSHGLTTTLQAAPGWGYDTPVIVSLLCRLLFQLYHNTNQTLSHYNGMPFFINGHDTSWQVLCHGNNTVIFMSQQPLSSVAETFCEKENTGHRPTNGQKEVNTCISNINYMHWQKHNIKYSRKQRLRGPSRSGNTVTQCRIAQHRSEKHINDR